MGVLQRLLETDIEKLQAAGETKYEVKRLSKILGEPFVISCKPLSNEQINHVVEISKTNMDTQLNTIFETCTIEGRKFSSQELLDKFKVASGKELISKMFLPGEISALYLFVHDISGFGKNSVKEVKN
jgi:hypothetical protein